MARGKRGPSKASKFILHVVGLGFTNRLAIYLVLILLAGLAGGFYLALLSIRCGYTGALACYTVVFTPIGTALSIVLSRIVDKSKAENRGPDGVGIKFAAAQAACFQQVADSSYNVKSPPI